jgi:CheY-like chemotaxis protein
MAGGHECILLVDDEKILLAVAGRVLSNLGYTVECAESPTDALALFSQAPDHFDLLITDWSMPGMTGDRLSAEIRKLRPDIPVIICSGFNGKLSQSTGAAIEGMFVLPKPFNIMELGDTVGSALDG